jgi:predicted lactoylglutathione lyase
LSNLKSENNITASLLYQETNFKQYHKKNIKNKKHEASELKIAHLSIQSDEERRKWN